MGCREAAIENRGALRGIENWVMGIFLTTDNTDGH